MYKRNIKEIVARLEKLLPRIKENDKYVVNIKQIFFEDLECLLRLINKEIN